MLPDTEMIRLQKSGWKDFLWSLSTHGHYWAKYTLMCNSITCYFSFAKELKEAMEYNKASQIGSSFFVFSKKVQ